MILEIRKYPDKILKKKAKPVGQIDAEIKKLIADMIETLYAKGGAGLAANQVGELKQIAVVGIGEGLNIFINPKIIDKKGKVVATEGCLSLPGYEFEIKRPQRIVVEYLDKKGREQKIKASDLLARVICHEVDHLQGKTLLDKLPIFKRLIAKRKLNKLAKETL
ncbi:MAG: peptide deformylase [Parcubacteria group bacterium LiPW_39]|nr:MAG: peptide deformylase [Parcubacteria group bacterium LiPW_39]